MTLNQLRYFCTASRCHSITKAAQELFVTQPTISIAIRDLEMEFAVTLFYRTGNQLVLTSEGEALYEKATYILQYCNEMHSECSSKLRKKPPVRIGIPPMLSTIFFPELLYAYMEKYPDSVVELEEYGSSRACDMVQNDELDIALVNMEVYNIDKFNHLVLAHDQLELCVTPEHKLANQSTIPTEELDHENLILFNTDSVQNFLLKVRFETMNINPHIVMRSSQIYTTMQFLKDGKCACFLFGSMFSKFPGYRRIPLDPPIYVNIGLVWKKGKYISNDMQNFITFTKNYYQKHRLIPDVDSVGESPVAEIPSL